ncbi:3-oxoacyl-[acyl-carrier-protein] reductase FabG [Ceratobasidium theobromae]|uniref:3-oxoacyl-[acyl-carrier-protein] reductase FabG n=1 Tax=Ceratobasidium theobromae TaxID=1582974 RepID=A0A5N5QFV2_9AGAM|nr:3-oxoacyl-[acyl-carrier-protein] reductase FabG [Ceratobasidium theobromae]
MTRVAIVTGAAQGIGRAIALRLAKDGLVIGINDIVEKIGEIGDLVAEIQSAGGRALSLPADVSTEVEVVDMVQKVVDEFGGLDVMVANAGIRRPGESLLEMSEKTFDDIMAVNCKGTLYSYRAAARQMIKQGPERGGRIIGASSVFGLRGQAERTPYCTSKFAIRAITQTAALEWGQYGITVNAYAPGPINTPLGGHKSPFALITVMVQEVPLKRMGEPEEVAALVSFLASRDASYITGQTLSVDGAQVMS